MSALVLRFHWLLLVASAAHAHGKVRPYSGPMRGFSLRDIGFERAEEDEYVESLAFTATFQGGASMDLSLVVTNLGMGDNNAGIKSELTAAGKTERYRVEVDDNWTQKPGRIHMDKTRVEGNLNELRVFHETPKYYYDLTFRRTAPSWRPKSGTTRFGDSGKLFYEFSLPMPMADVEGRVRLGSQWFPLKGTGYVDHSRTNMYSHEQAHRWHRFRGISDGTLVQLSRFITTPEYGSLSIGWLVVLSRDAVLHESYDYSLALSDLRADREYKNYRVAWRYDLKNDAQLSGFVKADTQAYRSNYLSSMGALKRLIVSQFAKPISVGLTCDFELLLHTASASAQPDHMLRGRGTMSQTFIK